MHRIGAKVPPLWIAAAISLSLVGCGGGSGTPATTAAATEEAAAKPPPPRADVEPLGLVGVPDVNLIGLLDGTDARWPTITNPRQRIALQGFGKALFWDMQVGGDGIQACASCHYNAGADNRKVNQVSPGLKRDGGPDHVADVTGLNTSLTNAHYNGAANGVANRGFAVNEAALQAIVGPTAADGPQGQPGTLVPAASKLASSVDVNDVASSQGVRAGTHQGVSANRVDYATLTATDPGFDHTFTLNDPGTSGIPNTVRRIEPRNSPTTLNAVYNLRNFWDGRADMFFNGVNPLGFRDPDARVKTYSGGTLGSERLNIPLSSLASQAVGPIGSDFEMVFNPRPSRDLGKKLTMPGAIPLRGQLVQCDDPATSSVNEGDSLLGTLTNCGIPDTTNRGLTRTYAAMIRDIFDQRFWGDGTGNDVCLDAAGAYTGTAATTPCDTTTGYTLMQWNFALFFGLGVQAYEATLFTEQTIVDLIAGGIAYGTVRNGRNVVTVGTVDAATGKVLNGLALPGCIALASTGNGPAAAAAATDVCTTHYAKFINANAVTGNESANALFPVANGTAIGNNGGTSQCGAVTGANPTTTFPLTTDNPAQTTGRCLAARNTLLNVERGLGRWFAGATACSVCHFNPEFTGATVSTLTGLGAGLPVLPAGQLRKELEGRALMERMVAFNGAVKVYDSGFYNLGVRPTGEDLSIGEQIGGVPLALTKLFDVISGGTDFSNNSFDKDIVPSKITGPIAASIALPITDPTGLRIPTRIAVAPPAPGVPAIDLAPAPFPWAVACGPGVQGGALANNNPVPQCVTTIVANEPLLRNGAFKAPGMRNVMFTGPYMHNGSKKDIRQVLEFYKTAGHFNTLNFNNLDAGMRLITLAPADEAAVVELLETGLTDWRVAHQQGKFDHPELCIPNGHDPDTGVTKLVAIPAVGELGGARIATFVEVLTDTAAGRANNLAAGCTVPGLSDNAAGEGNSLIDVPPPLPTLAELPPAA